MSQWSERVWREADQARMAPVADGLAALLAAPLDPRDPSHAYEADGITPFYKEITR